MATLAERRDAWRAKKATPSGSLKDRLAAFKAQSQEPEISRVPADVPIEANMQQPPAPAPERGVLDYLESGARGVNRGLMDLVDAPIALGNLATAGTTDAYNLVTGSNVPTNKFEAKLPSKFIDENTGEFITKGTQRNIPKGEDPIADFMYTGGEFGGSALMPVSKAAGMRKSIPDLLRAGKGDVIMGTGAATAGLVTEGNPYAEVVGSLAAPWAVSRAGNVVEMGKGAFKGLTEGQDVTAAARENLILQATTGTGIITDAKRAIAAGEKGTLAQITGDGGLFNAEAAVDLNAPAGIALQAARNERNQQTVSMLRDGGDTAAAYIRGLDEVLQPVQTQRLEDVATRQQADTMSAEAQMQQEMMASQLREQKLGEVEAAERAAKQQSQEGVNVAQEGLKKSIEALDPNIKPSDASRDFTKTWTAEQKARYEADVQPLYKAFEETPVPVQVAAEVKANITDPTVAGKGMSKAQIAQASRDSDITQLVRGVNDWDDAPVGIDLQAAAQQAKEVAYNNSGAGGGKKNKAVQKMADNIAAEIDTKLKANSPEYAAANKAFTEHKKTIAPDVYTDLKKKGVPEAEIARKFLKMKEGGATTAGTLAATDSKAVVEGFETYLRSVANAEGVDAGFMKNYDELLDAFPDSRELMEGTLAKQTALTEAKAVDTAQEGSLTKAVEAQRKGKQAETKQRETTLPKALETSKKSIDTAAKSETSALEKTLTGKYLEAPNKAIDKMINSKDRGIELDKFLAEVKDIEGSKAGLKQAMLTRVTGLKTKDVGKGLEFNDDMVTSTGELANDMLERGIINQKEFDGIKDTLGRIIIDDMAKTAKPPKGATMTQAKRVVASAISMATLRGTGQNSLIMANAVRRFFLDKTPFAGKETAEIRKAMDEMLANPEKFLEGAKLPKGKLTQAQADKVLEDLIRKNAVRTAQTIKDEE